jgi:hypothetical protein
MSKFIVGNKYKDQLGQEYTFLSESNGIAIFQFRNVQRKFKLIEKFGSISMACNLRHTN